MARLCRAKVGTKARANHLKDYRNIPKRFHWAHIIFNLLGKFVFIARSFCWWLNRKV